jgi:hypothetical protein
MAEYAGDKCTVVSIVPFPIDMEEKPGVCPGRFSISASVNGVPEVLVVGKSIAQVILPGDRPPLVVEIPPSAIARSIVEDYLMSQLAASPDAGPGITWFPGELTSRDVTTKYSAALLQLRDKQKRWFVRLVEIADTDWARYKSHRVIADFQRFACKELGLTRDWLVTVEPQSPIQCPACKTTLPADTVICPACRCVLDAEKYKTMKFA